MVCLLKTSLIYCISFNSDYNLELRYKINTGRTEQNTERPVERGILYKDLHHAILVFFLNMWFLNS